MDFPLAFCTTGLFLECWVLDPCGSDRRLQWGLWGALQISGKSMDNLKIMMHNDILYTQDLPKIYPRFTQDLPKIYPRFTQDLLFRGHYDILWVRVSWGQHLKATICGTSTTVRYKVHSFPAKGWRVAGFLAMPCRMKLRGWWDISSSLVALVASDGRGWWQLWHIVFAFRSSSEEIFGLEWQPS